MPIDTATVPAAGVTHDGAGANWPRPRDAESDDAASRLFDTHVSQVVELYREAGRAIVADALRLASPQDRAAIEIGLRLLCETLQRAREAGDLTRRADRAEHTEGKRVTNGLNGVKEGRT